MLDEQYRIATLERIARHTVGIAVNKNTGVGTGSLISSQDKLYILTAAHVIGDSPAERIRFWFRPTTPIKERPAADTTDADVGGYHIGTVLPIDEIQMFPDKDIAILALSGRFTPPDGSEAYHIASSQDVVNWPEQVLDGLSLVVFGFPTDNSRAIARVGDNIFFYIGCASLVSDYSSNLNSTAWPRLPSSLSREKDFVFAYSSYSEEIGPRGFSGAGVWVLRNDPKNPIWRADPMLIGVTHKHFKGSNLLAATKLSAIIESKETK